MKFVILLFFAFNCYASGTFDDGFNDGFDDGFDTSLSDETQSLDNDFNDGFNDGFDNNTIEKTPSIQPKNGSIYGSINLESHYNISNNTNLSSLKILADIIGEYKLNDYKITTNIKAYYDSVFSLTNNYPSTPEGYEKELNINELSIEGSVNSNLDFKIGRQIVAWGKSDNIRITDILNPIDNRTPGLVDIKNLRLGRFMSKFDYYTDKLNISLIVLHENNFSNNPKFGSDFKTTPDLTENKPNNSLKNTGVGLSLTGEFSGYDFGVYFANTYLDKPYFNNGKLQFDDKVKMLGFAYNQVVDSFLFKTELAYFDNITYSGVADEKSRLDSLIGVEYNGISDTTLSYEFALRNINNYDANINSQSNNFTKKESYQHAVRVSKSYLNQTLDVSTIIGLFGKDGKDGGFARISLDYALNDEISISGGVIDYIGGDNPMFESYKDNDKIFSKLTYNF